VYFCCGFGAAVEAEAGTMAAARDPAAQSVSAVFSVLLLKVPSRQIGGPWAPWCSFRR
jgi:hypothetical protein